MINMKKLTVVVALFVILLASSIADSFGQMIPDGVYYIHPYGDTSLAMDNSGNIIADGNNIRLWDVNSTLAQQWIVENTDGGIKLRNMTDSDYVVDNDHLRLRNYNNIMLNIQNDGPNQLWIPKVADNDSFYLCSSQDPFYCISWSGRCVNGANICLYEFTGDNDNIKWHFEPVR